MKLKRFVLAPDSFKGTMTAQQVCDVMEGAILRHLPGATVLRMPVADGGEGLVDAAMDILGGRRVCARVSGPFGEPMDAPYAILPDGQAVIEMAACAGLPLAHGRLDPMRATTYGVGQLLLDALDRGATGILLGLGGSATNDGGIGMAAALGYRFWDSSGSILEPLAMNLAKIAAIEPPKKPYPLQVVAACDVDNPLTGPQGAAYTFGRQKGAGPDDQAFLDEGLHNLGRVMEQCLGRAVDALPGAGAAGGLGAGVMAFLQGALKPGIELLLDAAHFDQVIAGADLVITGEGRIDWQTAHGKVPCGVAGRARKQSIPCIALCGAVGEGVEAVYDCGIDAVFAAVRGACTFEDIQKSCREDMRLLADAVVRTLIMASR